MNLNKLAHLDPNLKLKIGVNDDPYHKNDPRYNKKQRHNDDPYHKDDPRNKNKHHDPNHDDS